MSAVRWLLSDVYCTCFADQTTKSGQWVISSSKQVQYTSDNSHLTADKFRRLPDFFHTFADRTYSPAVLLRFRFDLIEEFLYTVDLFDRFVVVEPEFRNFPEMVETLTEGSPDKA